MIIWHRQNKDGARDALLAAVKSGELPLARVDEAVRRVLAVKMRRGVLSPKSPLASSAALACVGSPHHRRVAREIARRAITEVWNHGQALPCSAAAAPRLVVMSANDDFLGAMRAVRPGGVEIHLPTRPDEAARARVAASAKRLVGRADRFIVTASNVEQAALAKAVAGAVGATVPVVGVALGAPYLLDDASRMAAHLCSYSWRPDAVRAVSRVIAGLDEAGGVAPVVLSSR
jgi:beta-N-acetylhexosaminidase